MLFSHIYSPNNRINPRVLAVLSALLLFSSGAVLAQTVELRLGQEVYEIELAKTSQQRQTGLMFRQHLSPRHGMLLVYPQPGDHRIWMKNVRIPLRVYWIDDNYVVVSVQRLLPCIESPCPVFSAPGDTRFVLELGDYEHRLARGDKIEDLAGVLGFSRGLPAQ
jgi:uncharacterized membrane protein (UPF0127 family)